jgi:ATP-binding cassette, subfamily F, member 3
MQSLRSAELADPAVYENAQRRFRLLNEFQESAEKLEELTGRWEVAAGELEKARAALAADEGSEN